MKQRVMHILEEQVNPRLMEHRGFASLAGIKDGVVTVRLEGACAGCPDAIESFERIVKAALRRGVPEIREVVLDTSGEDEMAQLARRILLTHGVCVHPNRT